MIASIEIWARAIQIFFSTVFSVILVWVIIRIWNNDFPKDDRERGERKDGENGDEK